MTVRSTSRGRPGAQTYLSRAVADAGSELGRYRSLSEVTIVGARVQPGADRMCGRPTSRQWSGASAWIGRFIPSSRIRSRPTWAT